ncbi:MAG: DUF2779 domain-containing protein [Candidatus Margulisbacteria bacterium]|nr:DUF2779 domain-containing protein [Candidatus Margulisiibacteriota bacterium]
MKSKPYLSKSKYLNGLQCPKLLWYEYNQKADIPKPGAAVQFAFAEGHRVGALAQQLFPNGLHIPRDWQPEKQAQQSLEAAKQRLPLFEAGFVFGQTYALADILVPVGEDEWDLIEVKSSTSVKEAHYHDAAFQRYVYQGAGLKIRRCYLLHINKEYVRRGSIDPEKFFVKQDITTESTVLAQMIENEAAAMLKVAAAADFPAINIGPQCSSPHDCPLIGLCWDFLPAKDNIFTLNSAGQKGFDLLNRGISKVTEVPDDYSLKYKQVIQVTAHRSGQPYVDREALLEFLGQFTYPLYYLDFETIAPALPLFEGVRPYQFVPFQFSLSRVDKVGAKPKHFSFLAPDQDDPRPAVLEQLQKLLGNKGSIIAYSAGFEKRCLKGSADAYPKYQAWVKETNDRFVDLLEPFQKFYYYHPDQAGRASLKNVLPALTGQSYEGLEIADGGVASAEFYRVTYGQDVANADREAVRSALEKYCDQDTRGMIDVVEALRQAVKD